MNMPRMNNPQMMCGMFNGGNFLNSIMGSIFNYGSMGNYGVGGSPFMNCNGSMNYDMMAGCAIGNILLNVGAAAASAVIADRKANSTESIQADANELQRQINAELDRLGADITESNYSDYSVTTEDWYIDEKDDIDADEKAITGKLRATDLASHQTTSKNCETKISELKKQKTAEGVTTEQIAELDKQIEAQESIKKDADEAIKKHNDAVAAEKEIEKRREALEARAEKEQAEVNKILNKIDDLIDKRDNALDIVENRKLDKALSKKDSTIISDDDYNNALKNNKDYTAAHLRKALSKYRNAVTDADKEKYRDDVSTIYSYLLMNNEAELTAELRSLAQLIC